MTGDAAGLTSGLTGEGIYQALISGEEVAKMIIDEKHIPVKINEFLKTKSSHDKFLKLLIKSGKFRNLLFDISGVLAKNKRGAKKNIDFVV